MSEHMVMGPTPPGTGVMKAHLGATFSKSTSPLRRKPLLREGSGTRVVPTSMMVAPGFTMSAVTNPGLPRGSDDDVGLEAFFLDVGRRAVEHGDSSVAGVGFLHHE